MVVDSTRIFKIAWYENLVSSVFSATLIWLVVMPVAAEKEWPLNALLCIFGTAGLLFLINCFVRKKVIVTSNELIMTSVFGQTTVVFKNIRTIGIVHYRYSGYQLYVVTEQPRKSVTMMRNRFSTETLEETKDFVLAQILLHHPEHYALINSPRHDVEDFWRK